MLKSFFLKALRLIILIVVFLQINFNSAFAQEIQSTQDVNSPSPKIQPQEEVQAPNKSETITQEEITKTSSSHLADQNRPQDPYSKYYDSMKQFNTEVYGKDEAKIDK